MTGAFSSIDDALEAKRASVTRKPRGKAAKASNDGPQSDRTLDEWMTIPLQTRDEFAAKALYECFGSHALAAMKLGFKLTKMKPAERRDLVRVIFETEGVKSRLDRDFADYRNNQTAVISRLTNIVLNGSDGQAISAASTLQRMVPGYLTPGAQPQTNVYLWAAVAGAAAVEKGQVSSVKRIGASTIGAPRGPRSIDDVLGYEPGAPVPLPVEVTDSDDATEAVTIEQDAPTVVEAPFE